MSRTEAQRFPAEWRKATFRLTQPVTAFLKIRAVAECKPMEELILDAIWNHFRIGCKRYEDKNCRKRFLIY